MFLDKTYRTGESKDTGTVSVILYRMEGRKRGFFVSFTLSR